jgi:hypothetical protein
VTVAPASEPITLADAKGYLDVDFDQKDALITRLISDARRYAEQMLHKSLVTQTIEMIWEPDPEPTGPLSGPIGDYDEDIYLNNPNIPLDGTAQIQIPVIMGPVQSLTSVEYQLTRSDAPEWTTLAATDANGNPNYRLDTYAEPNELNVFASVTATRYRLTYVAGSLSNMQFDLRGALFSLINYWYEYREGAPVPDGIRQQLAERRVISL